MQTHMQHMVAYGVGNAKRWGGPGCKAQPSSSVLDFTVGMENRSASVRIPHSVLLLKRGWCAPRPHFNLHLHALYSCTSYSIHDLVHICPSNKHDERCVLFAWSKYVFSRGTLREYLIACKGSLSDVSLVDVLRWEI